MIAIIDYGTGNLASIKNMFSYIGITSVITNQRDVIKKASKIVLPGVGTFDRGIENLKALDLIDILEEQVVNYGKPFLGICLGMQLLGLGSEEGDKKGLGWIKMYAKKFPQGDKKVPHMGWNTISEYSANALVTEANQKFYFVHSFYVETEEPEETILKTSYGVDFASGVAFKNIFGVQFHPEKSHKYGMSLLSKFGSIQC